MQDFTIPPKIPAVESVCHVADLELLRKSGGWRWSNFHPDEFACTCGCNEAYFAPDDFTAIQKLRTLNGRAIVINSAHRCAQHNADSGGATDSQHLRIAFDVPWGCFTFAAKERLNNWLNQVGFYSRGLYKSFIHIDTDPACRFWQTRKGAYWGRNVIRGKLPAPTG